MVGHRLELTAGADTRLRRFLGEEDVLAASSIVSSFSLVSEERPGAAVSRVAGKQGHQQICEC